MILLIKLLFLPIWLALKIIGELVEHSGRRRRHRHHRVRIVWLPGRADFMRWSSEITRRVKAAEPLPLRVFFLMPIAALGLPMMWCLVVYLWLLWWMLMIPWLVLTSLA